VDRTGVYLLSGPDPDDPLRMRAYIGEADSVRERIDASAKSRGFWETAIVVTTSDDALNKGHVRYLEARLIEMARTSGRAVLDNGNDPSAERRRLSEADRANMEAFLANMRVVLPVVGLDLLKPRILVPKRDAIPPSDTQFEMRHKTGVKATAIEQDGEFVVLAGSQALKDAGYVNLTYGKLKEELIGNGVLSASDGAYTFQQSFPFKSPSAAAAVVLDRNANGRYEWKVVGSKLTYHEWQEQDARATSDSQ
jgi:hypothetical protein